MTPDHVSVILHRLDEHGRQLERIEQHAERTNGRVTALERAWERGKGFMAALGLAVPLLTAIAVKALT